MTLTEQLLEETRERAEAYAERIGRLEADNHVLEAELAEVRREAQRRVDDLSVQLEQARAALGRERMMNHG